MTDEPQDPPRPPRPPRDYEWAEDRCAWCGIIIGWGLRFLHLGECDDCRRTRPPERPKQPS